MENVCIMDCHACTLQEGLENKSLCASLLMPAMINRLSQQLSRIETALGSKEINEVVLDVKPIKKKKNEDIKEQNNGGAEKD